MAPTEMLARQHARTLAATAGTAGPAGGAAGRQAVLPPTGAPPWPALATGHDRVAVGTHALLEDGVAFHDLGLVVIDEQHRFGVGQRLDLVVKGRAVDVLLMTATPIPRSLVLAAYGDLATSQLRTKPPGRHPIVTRAVPNERIEEVLDAIERALGRGERIYWICPVIEGGEENTADGRGRAPSPAGRALRRCRRLGRTAGSLRRPRPRRSTPSPPAPTRLLVATTVVEVGVDVPEASIIVIEHAERFGLAQLHQLRGRVGRGHAAVLLPLAVRGAAGPRPHAPGWRSCGRREDGFAIAEEDLRLRGPGEVLGLRQSGLPAFPLRRPRASRRRCSPSARGAGRAALAGDRGLAADRRRSRYGYCSTCSSATTPCGCSPPG